MVSAGAPRRAGGPAHRSAAGRPAAAAGAARPALLSDVFPLRALPEPPADDTATTMPTITSPKMMAPMITALTFLSFPRERPRRA